MGTETQKQSKWEEITTEKNYKANKNTSDNHLGLPSEGKRDKMPIFYKPQNEALKEKQKLLFKKYFKNNYNKKLLRQAVVKEYVRKATKPSINRADRVRKTQYKSPMFRFFKRTMASIDVTLTKMKVQWSTSRTADIISSRFTKKTPYKQIQENVEKYNNEQKKTEFEEKFIETAMLMLKKDVKFHQDARGMNNILQKIIVVMYKRQAILDNNSGKSDNPTSEEYLSLPEFPNESIPKLMSSKETASKRKRKKWRKDYTEEHHKKTYKNIEEKLKTLYKNKYNKALPENIKPLLEDFYKAKFRYQVQKLISEATPKTDSSKDLEKRILFGFLADLMAREKALIMSEGIPTEDIKHFIDVSPLIEDHTAIIVGHFVKKAPEPVSFVKIYRMIIYLNHLDTENILSKLSKKDIETVLKKEEEKVSELTGKNYQEPLQRVYMHASEIICMKKIENRIVHHINKKRSRKQHGQTKKEVNTLLKGSMILKLSEKRIKNLLKNKRCNPEQTITEYIKNLTIVECSKLYKLSRAESLALSRAESLAISPEHQKNPAKWSVLTIEEKLKNYAYNRNYILTYYIKKYSDGKGVDRRKHREIKKEITNIILSLPEECIGELTENFLDKKRLTEVMGEMRKERYKKILGIRQTSLTLKELDYIIKHTQVEKQENKRNTNLLLTKKYRKNYEIYERRKKMIMDSYESEHNKKPNNSEEKRILDELLKQDTEGLFITISEVDFKALISNHPVNKNSSKDIQEDKTLSQKQRTHLRESSINSNIKKHNSKGQQQSKERGTPRPMNSARSI